MSDGGTVGDPAPSRPQSDRGEDEPAPRQQRPDPRPDRERCAVGYEPDVRTHPHRGVRGRLPGREDPDEQGQHDGDDQPGQCRPQPRGDTGNRRRKRPGTPERGHRTCRGGPAGAGGLDPVGLPAPGTAVDRTRSGGPAPVGRTLRCATHWTRFASIPRLPGTYTPIHHGASSCTALTTATAVKLGRHARVSPQHHNNCAVVERLQPRDDLVDEAGCLRRGLPDPDSCGLERLGLGRSRA